MFYEHFWVETFYFKTPAKFILLFLKRIIINFEYDTSVLQK